MLINNANVENLVLRNPFITTGTYTNSTGSTVALTAGRVMGQILTGGKWAPQVSGSTDGSEQPRAVLADSYSVANGATVTINLLTRGELNKNVVTLDAGDTWASVVRTVTTGGGSIEALLIANTGIILQATTELSGTDNQ